jgi:hypothetical protein
MFQIVYLQPKKLIKMKNIFLKVILALGLITFCGCNQKADGETKQETEQTVETPEPHELIQKTVEGTVVEINNGKDGYTAKLETAEKEFYFVTISHANLRDVSQYKSVQIGDHLKVTGDLWQMEDANQITVRNID